MRVLILLAFVLLHLSFVPVTAEQLIMKEVSIRTFATSIDDKQNHPLIIIDDLANPRPVGPGRSAGGIVMLNNKVYDWDSGQLLGSVHGICHTVDHGDDGPYIGERRGLGIGGPYSAACQVNYILNDGQLVVAGNMNITGLERDVPQTLAITGGTGKYMGMMGQLTIQQDPPGQPRTYKVVAELKPVIK